MRGQVLQATPGGGGIIVGEDGNRYGFSGTDWKGAGAAAVGLDVDFIAQEGVAADIFPLPGRSASFTGASAAVPTPVPQPAAPTTSEGSSVALGIIGIALLVLGFVVPVIPTIAAFIFGLIGAGSAKRHNNDTGLILSRIAWIGALASAIVGLIVVVALAIFAWPLIELAFAYIWHVMNEGRGATSALLMLLG